MTQNVLLIERPGAFRDALKASVESQGAAVHVRDDALEALASVRELAPSVVLVSDDPGPPGPISLCRIIGRVLSDSSVYRIGEPGQRDILDCDSPWVSRALGPAGMAATILGEDEIPPSGIEMEVAAGQLPQLLLWLADRSASGSLLLEDELVEREIMLLRGMPVFSRSSVLKERLGALAVEQGKISRLQLQQALDLCRADDLRIGEALIALKAIDGSTLFRLLATQVRTQVADACAGMYRARFLESEEHSDDIDLLRVHPMASVLSALQRSSKATIAGGFERLAQRPVERVGRSSCVESWLRGLGCADPETLLSGAKNLAELKRGLAERLGEHSGIDLHALCLSLLAARVLAGQKSAPAAGGAISPRSSELLRLVENVPAFQPPAQNLSVEAPTSTWQHQLDAYIFAPLDRDGALLGAAAEATPAAAELHALYVLVKSQRDPWSVLGVDGDGGGAAVRLAYHKRLEQLDAAVADLERDAVMCRATELRRAFDRARDGLIGLDAGEGAASSRSPQSSSRMPSTLPAASASSSRPARAVEGLPAPPPLPVSAAMYVTGSSRPQPPSVNPAQDPQMAEIELLLQHPDWREISALLEKRLADEGTLPAHLGLIYAIALKEVEGLDTSGAHRTTIEPIGIRAMAELLGVSEESTTAVVVAKRTLRRRQLEEPKGKPGVVKAALLIAVGVGVGLLLNPALAELLAK